VLDRPGLARAMSLPPGADEFASAYLHSYRTVQGVLHNPKSDRRTTQGVFHIVEGGLPIPADKLAVPRPAFAKLLAEALNPPPETATLPFTADQDQQARLFVSLLLRPVVCPATGTDPAKTMEIRFFAPGNLVSNLDFVETIFGNGGDPYLPENDAALDVLHWTGHTGCVILAPHIVGIRKQELGLPHFDQATERQRRDGMCWREEGEPYNNGGAFKLVCRDRRGVIVTLIADNYYGYCKKEVKSQISFAANLFGLCEEEHAGGAIAFPSYALGQDFHAERSRSIKKNEFEEAMRLLGDRVERRAEGYAVDRKYPNIFYVPESAEFHLARGSVKWPLEGGSSELTLLPDRIYVGPSGYQVRLEKQHGGAAWRLVGSVAHGTLYRLAQPGVAGRPAGAGPAARPPARGDGGILLHRPGSLQGGQRQPGTRRRRCAAGGPGGAPADLRAGVRHAGAGGRRRIRAGGHRPGQPRRSGGDFVPHPECAGGSF
jgi:hypothetical protein